MAERILLSGYYGYQNLGDEAILAAILAEIRRIKPGIHICAISAKPDETRERYGVESIGIDNLGVIIEKVKKSDYLLVGGGGIFQDYWGANREWVLTSEHRGIPFYSCLPLLGWFLEKPVFINSVGIGPLFSKDGSDLTRLSFNLASSATVRDRGSLLALKSIGYKNDDVEITVDGAINTYPNFDKARAVLAQEGLDPSKPFATVSLRNWQSNTGSKVWITQISNELEKIIKQTGYNLALIPFQRNSNFPLTDDLFLANQVFYNLNEKNKVKVMDFELDPETVCGLIGLSKVMIGMRYHSILFASITGVPSIGICYDVKVEQLITDWGIGEYSIKMEDPISTINPLFNQVSGFRENLQTSLAEKSLEMKTRANNNSSRLEKFFENPKRKQIVDEQDFNLIKSLSLQWALKLGKITSVGKNKIDRDSIDKKPKSELIELVISDQALLLSNWLEKEQEQEKNNKKIDDFQGRLSEKDSAIESLSKTIEENKKKYSRLQRNSDEIKEGFLFAINEKDSAIKKYSDLIQQSNDEIRKINKEIEVKNNEIEENKNVNFQKEEKIGILEKEAGERGLEISGLRDLVSQGEERFRQFKLDQDDVVKGYEQTLLHVRADLAARKLSINELSDSIKVKEARISTLINENSEKRNELDSKENEINSLINNLNSITSSTAWKLMHILWRIRKTLLPEGSGREKLAIKIWRLVLRFKNKKAAPIKGKRNAHPKKFSISPIPPFKENYIIQDNSRVTLFTDDDSLLPFYTDRHSLEKPTTDELQVTLVASLKNEKRNIERWINCISRQTRQPDEIIIVDGGSTDGSCELIGNLSKRMKLDIRLFHAPESNMAFARNLAIKNSKYPIIVVTDFGCQPNLNWLELLLRPFIFDPNLVVSAGYYDTIDEKGRSLSGKGLWPHYSQIDPQSFLPSSRSVAFKRVALDAVGGHPEWLTKTGDDTYLDLELKRLGGHWGFVPGAIVKWVAPPSLFAYLRKMFSWAIGDGESGVHAIYYWRYFLRLLGLAFLIISLIAVALFLIILWPSLIVQIIMASLVLLSAPILLFSIAGRINPGMVITKVLGQVAQVAGFLKGFRNRIVVLEQRINQTKGLFIIFSGVPIDDTGGGARGAQIANELLNRGFWVTFIHKFAKDESLDLKINYLHPNLERYASDKFDILDFIRKKEKVLKIFSPVVLVEFPHRDFIPAIDQLKELTNPVVIYDIIDDWSTNLGGKWFEKHVEYEFEIRSDILTATHPALQDRLEKECKRKPLLLPNAVNNHLFNKNIKYSRPSDLPPDRKIAIYVGALWGSWFDWDLLEISAKKNPEITFVLIGDTPYQARNLSTNIHPLGLKPQSALPHYLAHSDVAIIPWKNDSITKATDPLKVYEYLAMGLPVVAYKLDHLKKYPGVFVADDENHFSDLVNGCSRSMIDQKSIHTFVEQNTWKTRVDLLLSEVNEFKIIRGNTQSRDI